MFWKSRSPQENFEVKNFLKITSETSYHATIISNMVKIKLKKIERRQLPGKTIVAGTMSSKSDRGVQWLDHQRSLFSEVLGLAPVLSSLKLIWVFLIVKEKTDKVN